jgi:hypothetical protein
MAITGINSSSLLGYYSSMLANSAGSATPASSEAASPVVSLDSSATSGGIDDVLLGYYNAMLASSAASSIAASSASLEESTSASASATGDATANSVPPWEQAPAATEQADVEALSSDPYFDTTDDPNLLTTSTGTQSSSTSLVAGANSESLLEALVNSQLSTSAPSSDSDLAAANDRLFAVYSALNRLDTLTQIATDSNTQSGQLPGLDSRFQSGLAQIASFVNSADFGSLTLMASTKTSSVTSKVSVPEAPYNYQGGAVLSDANYAAPVPNVDSTDSFTISVTVGGRTTDVPVDLSQVSGPLTLDNIAAYANQQLAADGFSARLQRTQTGGDITAGTATWGLSIINMGAETISLSSGSATPSIYVAGTTGDSDDQQGKLIKLSDLDGDPTSVYSRNVASSQSGSSSDTTTVTAASDDTSTATSTTSSATSAQAVTTGQGVVTDSQGNVYVIGDTDGSFGSEVNQGSQDVYLRKYDSAGNVLWTKLLGSAASASAFSIAAAPNGGVVIAGSTTGDLSQDTDNSNTDSFVAKYDSDGNQTWVKQLPSAAANTALSVTTAPDGSIYVGGQTNGTIASGQTNSGGQDAYVAKFNANGDTVFTRQFGTSGSDSVQATALASDGNLLVASTQDGDAILSKYSSTDGSSPPIWSIDLGSLQEGSIAGIATDGDQVYVAGTTSNGNLTAGGAATIANPNSGGTDAFVFGLTDAGSSAVANQVSYVGTGATDRASGIVVSDGNVYLSGTTTGIFPGQVSSVAGGDNIFVAQLSGDGTVGWARQYGGLSGQSRGAGIALDTQGAGVLDALGLPRGKIDNTQSSELASETTVRPGDSFSMLVTDSAGTHRETITVDDGETMSSLATKISNALAYDGTAQALYTTSGTGLKISVNSGVNVQLESGPQGFDALAGLGINPMLLTGPDASSSSSSSSSSSTSSSSTTGQSTSGSTTSATSTSASSDTSTIIGLGLTGGVLGPLSLATTSDANDAHIALQGAMAQIQQAYQTLNGLGTSTSAASASASGPVPSYVSNQLTSYQNALALLGGSSSGSDQSSSLLA